MSKPIFSIPKKQSTIEKEQILARHENRNKNGIPQNPDNTYIAQMVHDLIQLIIDTDKK